MKKKNIVLFLIGFATVIACIIIIAFNKDKLQVSNTKTEETNTTITDSKIFVQPATAYNLNTFDIYLEKDDVIIYKRPNIEEIYYTETDVRTTLKEYLSTTFQTTSDGIKNITDLLEFTTALNDGGTQIYKSNDYNITIIKCNTLKGNKDIYIGMYDLDFAEDEMCTRES